MKVKAVRVAVFELFDCQGVSLGLFQVESEWKGMRALRALKGDEQLILDSCDPSFAGLFADIFGSERGEMTVVKSSPETATKLKEAANARGIPG